MNALEHKEFRRLCEGAGLAVTHQRQVIFEVLSSMPGHPSPEETYARVRKRIPAVSIATVYKNIHLFIKSGIFGAVSEHHGSLRIETNPKPHHHLVCTVCKSIEDIDEGEVNLSAKPSLLKCGFLAERFAVDILGRCSSCRIRENQES